jgi:transcriptional repressor NrdR
MEGIVDDIEAELQQRHHREVSSAEIGEMVLTKLRPLNEVAFVRFASVYRQFQGIRDFTDTLSQLQDTESPMYAEDLPQSTEPPLTYTTPVLFS